MTFSKKYQTILTNLILSIVGVTIAYLTNWWLVVPILFGLGIPMVNMNKPFKQKLGLTLVIVIVIAAIFMLIAMSGMAFDFDKYLYAPILVGIAGLMILGINGLLIDEVIINKKSAFWTFFLSWMTLPIWIYLTENYLNDFFERSILVRQLGIMLFWMVMTTIGISTGIKKTSSSNTQSH